MDVEELKYWLCWNRVPGIGPTRFFKLFDEFGSMKKAWDAPLEQLSLLIGDKACRGYRDLKTNWDPELELRKAEHLGIRIRCFTDTDYPVNLKKIPDPPPVLYTRGVFDRSDDLAIGIVGTRTPTPVGMVTARELAVKLAEQGLTIVSGMARGIDSEAHWGALEAGGRTIAVLGCGLDIIYPSENRNLMEQLSAKGMVISEFALGTQPLSGNFPARNRIISGLSLGVVVVEATQDSGSLITASFALEQGREVFAVPGNIGNDRSQGPHRLIRQGAKLVENYHDILAELAIPQLSLTEIQSAAASQLDENETKVAAVMSREPIHINQINRLSGLTPAATSSILIQLELKGVVKRFPGQLYLRVK